MRLTSWSSRSSPGRRWRSALALAGDRFGDPLDTTKARVPRRPDRVQLRSGSGEFGFVDPITLFATFGVPAHQSGAVQHAEVFGDGLPRDGEALAERGRGVGAVGEQQVEHMATGRIADRGPEVVVDLVGRAARHDRSRSVATYGPRLGRKMSHPRLWSRWCQSRSAASQILSRYPVSVIVRRVPSPDAVRSNVTNSELDSVAG